MSDDLVGDSFDDLPADADPTDLERATKTNPHSMHDLRDDHGCTASSIECIQGFVNFPFDSIPSVPPPTREKVKSNDARHSPDFRSVRWHGITYSFTANQSKCVEMLWKAWEAGTPDVGHEALLLAVDHEAPPDRMSTLFRGHPAWGTMICRGETKGTRRLSAPAENP